MCDAVSAITAGLKIATAVQDYRSKKVVAESQQKANEITRKNSDQAYLNDLAKIDAEKVAASREKKAEQSRNRTKHKTNTRLTRSACKNNKNEMKYEKQH